MQYCNLYCNHLTSISHEDSRHVPQQRRACHVRTRCRRTIRPVPRRVRQTRRVLVYLHHQCSFVGRIPLSMGINVSDSCCIVASSLDDVDDDDDDDVEVDGSIPGVSGCTRRVRCRVRRGSTHKRADIFSLILHAPSIVNRVNRRVDSRFTTTLKITKIYY